MQRVVARLGRKIFDWVILFCVENGPISMLRGDNVIGDLFWNILGIGIAVPSTVLVAYNIWIKAREGDNYELGLYRLAIIYLVALAGWAIAFGIR